MIRKTALISVFALAIAIFAVFALSGCVVEGEGIVIDKTEVTIYIGESFNISVSAENGGYMTDFTVYLDNDVVEIDESLTVTGQKEGTSVITFAAGDGSSAECKVTVLSHPQTLSVIFDDKAGYVGDTMGMSITVSPATATYTYEITSSDESVISVSGDRLIFNGEGKAEITVTTDNGLTCKGEITSYPLPEFSFGEVYFDLYDSITVITDALSMPVDIVALPMESSGYVYEGEDGYTVIFTDGDLITGFYTDSMTFGYGEVRSGQTLDEVSDLMENTVADAYTVVLARNGVRVTVFCDTMNENRAYGILVTGKGSEFSAPDEAALEGYAKVLFGLTNSLRKRNGLAPLEYFESLEVATAAHCQDMITNRFVSHTSSDGRKLEARMNALDIGWHYCAENIAVGYDTPFTAHAALLNSEGHRGNILSEKYSLTGLTTLYDAESEYKIYTTQLFCTLF